MSCRQRTTSTALDEGVFLQFAEPGIDDIQMQHYAFLVDDRSFDEIYGRILQGGIEYWADPQATQPGRINTNHGGRGVYFHDPAGLNPHPPLWFSHITCSGRVRPGGKQSASQPVSNQYRARVRQATVSVDRWTA